MKLATRFRKSLGKTVVQSKVDLRAFDGVKRYEYKPGLAEKAEQTSLFIHHQAGFRYDFVLSKKRSEKLFVVFSGYADRKKLAPPVFQRWKWVDRFPGNVLYVSDPSLYLSEKLSLAWYIGTEKVDHFDVISFFVSEIARELKIKNTDIVSYGSSGGGFAAIRLGNFMPGICCVAINPQTEIKRYSRPSVNSFLRSCFNTTFEDFDFEANARRFSLLKNGDEEKKRVILAQNLLDESHYINHYLPYCGARGVEGSSPTCSGRMKTILFKHKDGHAAAETNSVFKEILSSIDCFD